MKKKKKKKNKELMSWFGWFEFTKGGLKFLFELEPNCMYTVRNH